ncbi:MAG: hypothetical protein PHH60_00970 [Candidatus Margulisbacteria bacterium]|nr:hypothetical protein [Candidatus Margulisiibacteriota bacterium]
MKAKKAYIKAFFGMAAEKIKQTVVISPIIYPGQFAKGVKYQKSVLGYLAANVGQVTFIKTPMTEAAVADLITLLPQTKCQQVIFIGAIGGLAEGLRIGDVVLTDQPKHVYSVRSIHEETGQKMRALRKQGIIGVDFEGRGFFAAAKKANLTAKAYFIVTDLPLSKPFYMKITAKDKEKIKDSVGQVIHECRSR